MPKSGLRRSPHWSSPGKGCLQSYVPHSGSLFLCTPRKVSFEENGSCNGSDSDSCEHSVVQQQQQQQETHPLSRKRSLLVRRKSSMSLVDLANQATMDEQATGESSSSSTVEDEHDGEERKAKRMCSPRTILTEVKDTVDLQPKPSPWGQFVDMLVPEDEERISPQLCYLDNLCSNMCCRDSSCRTRRSSPYGDYKNRSRRALAPPSHLQLQQDTFASSAQSTFRLAPRIVPSSSTADQLIGPLSDLNF